MKFLKIKHFTIQIIPRVCSRLIGTSQKFYAPQNFSDYEEIRSYKQDQPEYFNFASDILDKWTAAEKDGSKTSNPALWWVNGERKEVKWSFDELGFHSRKVANILSDACDLKPGDRVLVILSRIPEWWMFNVACMRAGLVLIPGTIQLTAKDVLYRLQTSGARCIITSQDLAPAVDSISNQAPLLKTKMTVSGAREGWLNFQALYAAANDKHVCVRTQSTDPMTIFFTSGTTGSPKMVEHSQCSYGLGLTIAGKYWMDLTPSDVFWNISDTGWAKSAWSNIFAPWIQGSCVFSYYMPRVNTTVILETLTNYPITVFCSLPSVYRMLVLCNLENYKFKSLQHCVGGGEPLSPLVMEQWKANTGLDIYEGFGQSETVLVCGAFKGMKIKPGSMGKASPAYDVQIVDADGNVLPPDQEGNFAIRIAPHRPFYLFTHYTGDPEKTASTQRGDFYLTGDRAIKDKEDYFWFVGRSDDVILSSGYRIGPFEIENALMEHPAVVESAVVSSPDPVRGEVVKAFIVLSPAYTAHDPETLIKEIQEHVKKVTAPYKYPRKIEFVQQLPKTIIGKVRRNELRNKEWGKA
ncbi:acyl-coenzyme A synthetase ACSM3, mitochondrial-like [Eleutherodactylus coqui]|uniref:acyl-coenzyme A synthetase ACSM3, mitochondrial-like n=1 Tax=Eleutherodactylus coqui TaxID=57060 RepID=UPI0034633B49